MLIIRCQKLTHNVAETSSPQLIRDNLIYRLCWEADICARLLKNYNYASTFLIINMSKVYPSINVGQTQPTCLSLSFIKFQPTCLSLSFINVGLLSFIKFHLHSFGYSICIYAIFVLIWQVICLYEALF